MIYNLSSRFEFDKAKQYRYRAVMASTSCTDIASVDIISVTNSYHHSTGSISTLTRVEFCPNLNSCVHCSVVTVTL